LQYRTSAGIASAEPVASSNLRGQGRRHDGEIANAARRLRR
jgi:hypothetical protein